MRQNTEKWSRTTTKQYKKSRKRKKGNQRKRWKDEIDEAGYKCWSRRAQNKIEWNMLKKTYAQKWV